MTTYTKLRNGDWGLRIDGSVEAGATVTATKKSGETKTERVGRVLWAGNGITLASIATNGTGRSSGSSRGRFASHADYIDRHPCRACGHDGDGCADMDCTCRTCGGMMR